jgi:chorismate mutase / prephenate dehydratase
MDPLDKLRKDINSADQAILKALAKRRKIADKIIGVKEAKDLPLRDTRREEELLAKLIVEGRKAGLDAHLVTRVFHEIIDDSVRAQQLRLMRRSNKQEPQARRVAFQGIEGAYSHLAAQKFFANSPDSMSYVGYPTFAEAVAALEQGAVHIAFLPIENAIAGSINEVYDLLSTANLWIVGEEIFPVEHCLLAVSDVPLSNIRRVYSHPQALAQCMKFLSKLENCQLEYYHDTAMAVRKVKEDNDLSQAAIGSVEAGRRYGLTVLKKDLADRKDNYTRFWVVAKEPITVDPRIPAKTSLLLATAHQEGALLRALSILHAHKINLTKLESRPRPGVNFEYLFYLDLEGNRTDENVQAALDELGTATSFLKILGSYPREARGKTPVKLEALVPEKKAAAEAPAKPKSKAAYKLVSREGHPDPTVINIKGVKVGGPEFVVMAGPCAVESREQIMSCAREVKECGGKILRGGCFKPRTSPYSFQGLGFEALEWMAEAGREYDLPIVTEVLQPGDVEPIAKLADIIQIGARNMQNFSLLKAVGRVNRPVMLKRGMSATLDEFLNAAEYILQHGNRQVMLCERGIRTFETMTRNTLDLGAIPILKRLTHLPVIVDPSHAAGQRELVVPLALAAHAVGPYGMMVEIHPAPEKALSDGPQSLTFGDFEDLMAQLFRPERKTKA